MLNYSTITMISLSVLLASCDTDTEAEIEDLSFEEQKEQIYESAEDGNEHFLSMVDRDEPVWAGISHTSDFGSISTDFVADIRDPETLEFIVDEMVEGSQRQPGDVDMAEPNYGLQIDYDDDSSETFYLWISPGESSGTLMDTSETHIIYTFAEEVSEEFLSLLTEENILE